MTFNIIFASHLQINKRMKTMKTLFARLAALRYYVAKL